MLPGEMPLPFNQNAPVGQNFDNNVASMPQSPGQYNNQSMVGLQPMGMGPMQQGGMDPQMLRRMRMMRMGGNPGMQGMNRGGFLGMPQQQSPYGGQQMQGNPYGQAPGMGGLPQQYMQPMGGYGG